MYRHYTYALTATHRNTHNASTFKDYFPGKVFILQSSLSWASSFLTDRPKLFISSLTDQNPTRCFLGVGVPFVYFIQCPFAQIARPNHYQFYVKHVQNYKYRNLSLIITKLTGSNPSNSQGAVFFFPSFNLDPHIHFSWLTLGLLFAPPS